MIDIIKFYVRFKKCPFCKHRIPRISKKYCYWCGQKIGEVNRIKIGDKIFVRGYIDEIRKDTVIVRNDGGYFGTILSEVTGELPSAQPEQQWIPCSERLPEKNVWVLVTFMMANGEVDIDIMRINRWDSAWETRDFDMAYRETVVAWMPLPEPYGGE